MCGVREQVTCCFVSWYQLFFSFIMLMTLLCFLRLYANQNLFHLLHLVILGHNIMRVLLQFMCLNQPANQPISIVVETFADRPQIMWEFC